MFLFKVKSHRGEPTHEEADIQEDKAISNKDVPMERCNSREQAFWQKSGNDRAFFLVGCVKKSRAARF